MEQSLANALTADGVCAAVGLSGAEFAARQLAEIPCCSASGQHCWDRGKVIGAGPFCLHPRISPCPVPYPCDKHRHCFIS